MAGPVEIEAEVDPDEQEVDPAAGETEAGAEGREVLWVSYFVTGGELDRDISLIADAEGNVNEGPGRVALWTPPAQPSSCRSMWLASAAISA